MKDLAWLRFIFPDYYLIFQKKIKWNLQGGFKRVVDSFVQQYQIWMDACNKCMQACEECLTLCLKEADVEARITVEIH
jgi:hypothetical protein